MNLQAFPPDVQSRFERVAFRNSLSTVELIARNRALSALTWEVIKIFELNFRHFLNKELSQLAKNANWWLDPEVIHKEHLSASSSNDDKIRFLSLGFLSLLLSDRYHKKLWVPYLQGALSGWELPRRELYQDLRLLVRIRNRIAHHEIIYNYPLVELTLFATKLLLSINPMAAKEIEAMKFADRIRAIKLGSGGGI